MRLIDADALLEALKEIRKFENIHQDIQDEYKDMPEVLLRNNLSAVEIINIITNAPTVQREGWVSVPIEPTEEMIAVGRAQGKNNELEFRHRDEGTMLIYKAMLSAAPKE